MEATLIQFSPHQNPRPTEENTYVTMLSIYPDSKATICLDRAKQLHTFFSTENFRGGFISIVKILFPGNETSLSICAFAYHRNALLSENLSL